jgi:myo-inositol-1-phosphate synthase
MSKKRKINVAIIGVGSLTKALVEGVSFYTKKSKEKTGLLNYKIGPYKVSDINFVAAFDIDKRKVGKKLHIAISKKPNVTRKIAKPLHYPAIVYRGPTLDGVIKQVKNRFVIESKEPVMDVAKILMDNKTDVVVNLVPTGSDKATHFYAEAALEAGCSFINCIPTQLATIPRWRKKFENKGLVLLGDDTKSQMGATMLNRFLLELFKMRGIKITKALQENKGGNMDHFNLLYRAKSKKKTKAEALTGFLDKDDAKPEVTFSYTGVPSGHKKVHLEIKGEIFGKTPIIVRSDIEDEISINGAGTVVDAIRIAKLLVDRHEPDEVEEVAPFLMKSPPEPMTDREALKAFKKVLNEK